MNNDTPDDQGEMDDEKYQMLRALYQEQLRANNGDPDLFYCAKVKGGFVVSHDNGKTWAPSITTPNAQLPKCLT